MNSIKAILVIMILAISLINCSSEPKTQQTDQVKLSDNQPQDEETLFNLATKAETVNRFEDAISYYEQIVADYPNSPRRDKALFMAGYIKYEYKSESKEALAYFNKVIEEYPNSDLVDDAEFMIKAIESGKDALTTFEEAGSGK